MRGFFLLLLLLTVGTSLATADGGVVLLHREAPPLVVTVFEAPAPGPAGGVDLSLLVQTSATLDAVLDARVDFMLSKGATRVHAQATHDRTQNRMLYAATLPVSAGNWHYTATVQTPAAGSPVSVSGVISAAGPERKSTEYAGYLALPFIVLALFALHQRLKQRRGLSPA
jgi:hypothetical protein